MKVWRKSRICKKKAVSQSFKFQWFEEGEKPRFVSLAVVVVNKKGKNRLCLYGWRMNKVVKVWWLQGRSEAGV